MKKFLFSLILLLVSYVGFSQKGLSYQAVILDPNKIEVPGQDISGQPLVNGDVWMKFSIFNGSTMQFEEVHKTRTDAYGLVNLMIGSVSTASFNALVWDSSQKSLYVYASFDQGGSYTKISEQKLTYSPYTLFAETAGKLGGVLGIAGGGTGATTVADARLNLGLDQVNNTSDAAKPVSTATQTALNLKANVTDVTSGLALKANTADVNAALALKANTAEVNAGLALKANTTDMTAALAAKADTGTIKSFVLTQVAAATIADTDASTKGKIQLAGDLAGTADAPTVPGLALKENSANKSTNLSTDGASDTKYPSVKSVKTYVDAQVSGATIADANANTKGKIQLAGDLGGTADAPTVPGLALKENSANKSTNVSTDGASDSKYPSVKAVKSYIDAQVSGATIPDANATSKGKIQLAGDLGGTAEAPTVPGLALKAPIASPTFTGTVTSPTYASTPIALTYSGSNINWNPAQGLNAAITLTQNSTLSFTEAPPVGSYGTIVLTQDGTGSRTFTLPTITSVSNKVLGSTSTSTVALSTVANSKDILNFYFDGTICYWNIGQGYGAAATTGTTNLATSVNGTLAVANGGTGATTASAALTSLGGAPLASPTFTGAVTAPIYASAPQALTDGTTISWDPSLGLNASVTLGGDRTLSFTTTPTAGAYGTLVVTQDGTGSRTLTLPSTTNKVLGSTSTTRIALSTTAGAKDIVNFYYDGTNCYWNVGQGYGAAATAATTNLASSVTGTLPVANGGTGAATLTGYVKGAGTATMTASATIPVADISGTLPVANGGTGAATLTGLVKGNGTNAMTAAVAGTDYLEPNGSAASLTSFPTLNQNTTGNAANVTGIVAVANGGTGTTNGSITGTTALSFAAGGSNQNVSILPSGTGSVGIGTNSPNSLAILDASSTTKGFLPPRMTYAQKMAIASPPQGLMIYCTNCGTNGEPEYYNGVAWVNMAGGTAASVPPSLGSTHEGGKIFYIFQPGEPGYVAGETHGLIAAPSDIPSNTYRILFGCYGDVGTSTALGTGAANTTKLIAGCNDAVNAAKLVDALTDGGYTDWYIPSKDELNLLYLNRNLVGNFSNWPNWYWSSSEWRPWAPEQNAWYQYMDDGTVSFESKGAQKGVRAIRSF